MRAALIVNPAAGQGRAKKMLSKAKLELESYGFNLTIYETTKMGEATRLAQKAVDQKENPIIVMGGDGTISEVVNGIAGKEVALGLIPTGTAEVFAWEMGIPFKLSLACRIIAQKNLKKIDLAKADGRYFVLVAGIGIDAQAVKGVSPGVKRVLKILAYPLTGLRTLITHQPALMRIKWDGESEEGYFVVVGNARYYAGRFSITPQASITDGFLDICIFKGKSLRSFIRYIQGVIRGKHLKYTDVCYAKAKEIYIEAEEPTLIQADGELIGETPMHFKVVPRALTVIAP